MKVKGNETSKLYDPHSLWESTKAVGSSPGKVSLSTYTKITRKILRRLWIPDWDLTALPKLLPQTAKFWQLLKDWFDFEHQTSTVGNFFDPEWQ